MITVQYHEQRTAGESHAHCALFERSELPVCSVLLLVSPVVFPVAVLQYSRTKI